MMMRLFFFDEQDGLWLVSQQPSVIQGYQKGILTPNFMEFTRLYESLVSQVQLRVIPVDVSCKQVVRFKQLGFLCVRVCFSPFSAQ